MATYKTISYQSVFDVCIKTKGDLSNLFDVVTQFGTINDYVTIGETVTYTPSTATRQLQKKIPIINTEETASLTADYQSVFDLAIQIYGDFSRIDEILPFISNLGSKVPIGTFISYTPNSDPVSQFFKGRIVATADFVEAVIDNVRLLEDGSFRLLEDGSYRLLE